MVISQLAVDSWQALQAKKITTQRSASATEGLRWDTSGFQSPGKDTPQDTEQDEDSLQKKSSRSTGVPTSLYMTGSISVGLVIVSGTQNDLSFSSSEQSKVISEVMEGLDFLANLEPCANVTFIYDIHLVSVNTIPASPSDCIWDNVEPCEKVWRDPALQELGYSPGYQGCIEFANTIKNNKGTDWSYVAFFTKYTQSHFAYAGGVRICMQYANDGWGPDNINKVFAHETCHIFGAADEYAFSECTCAPSGVLKIPNNNCENCPGEHVPCLMKENTLQLCKWSKWQIGWESRFFQKIAGKLKQISVGSADHIWGVTWDGVIYQYLGRQ